MNSVLIKEPWTFCSVQNCEKLFTQHIVGTLAYNNLFSPPFRVITLLPLSEYPSMHWLWQQLLNHHGILGSPIFFTVRPPNTDLRFTHRTRSQVFHRYTSEQLCLSL